MQSLIYTLSHTLIQDDVLYCTVLCCTELYCTYCNMSSVVLIFSVLSRACTCNCTFHTDSNSKPSFNPILYPIRTALHFYYRTDRPTY